MTDRSRFIVYKGIFGWGIPAWLLFSLFKVWQDTREFDKLRTDLALLYIAMLPFWLLGGYVWGRWMWGWMERRKRLHAAMQEAKG